MWERRNRHQSPRADRDLRDRRRRLQAPVHGQGRRLGQQEVPLPGDQGGAEPEADGLVPRREAPRLGTAACPPYHLAIVVGGTSAEYALKTAKYASARYLDALPTEGSMLGHGFRDVELEQRFSPSPGRSGSAPNSAASTSATTCGWSGCLGTGRRARWRSRSPARPTGRRSPRSPPRASSSSSSRPTRPGTCRTRRVPPDAAEVVRSTSAGRWRRSAPSSPVPGQDPALADRAHGGRPRHRPRQDRRAARRGRADAVVPARPLGLLRRPGQDPGRVRVRARSGRRRRDGWTPTSSGSRRPAGRW